MNTVILQWKGWLQSSQLQTAHYKDDISVSLFHPMSKFTVFQSRDFKSRLTAMSLFLLQHFQETKTWNFRNFSKIFEGSWKMCVEVGSASIIFRYLTSRLNIWTRKINLNGEFQCYFLASYLNFLVFLNF